MALRQSRLHFYFPFLRQFTNFSGTLLSILRKKSAIYKAAISVYNPSLATVHFTLVVPWLFIVILKKLLKLSLWFSIQIVEIFLLVAWARNLRRFSRYIPLNTDCKNMLSEFDDFRSHLNEIAINVTAVRKNSFLGPTWWFTDPVKNEFYYYTRRFRCFKNK